MSAWREPGSPSGMSFDDEHPGTASPGAEEVDRSGAIDQPDRKEKSKAREGGAPAPEGDKGSDPAPDSEVPQGDAPWSDIS